MLHQTLPTFLSIQSICSSSAIPCHSPSQVQVKKEMEAKALKTSFLNLKSIHEPVSEDVWVENVIPGDDFFVDDLLDFSKEEIFQGEDEEQEEKDFVSVSSNHDDNSNGVSVKDDISLPSSELSVPADDIEQLEWLSHFVEDSFSLPYPEGTPLGKTENPKPQPKQQETLSETETETETERGLKKTELSTTPFPAKARSKRSRTGVRVWSLGSSTETSTSVSASSSTSSGSFTSSSCLVFNPTTPNHDFYYYFDKPPAKKPKKKKMMGEPSGAQTQRRCSHCGVQKTPQWRQGPQGAKTLCNACGVRFKSGRLLPEYRPASSPTFSSDVHSNNHRKVMEMRKKKEVGPPVSGFGSPVQSF